MQPAWEQNSLRMMSISDGWQQCSNIPITARIKQANRRAKQGKVFRNWGELFGSSQCRSSSVTHEVSTNFTADSTPKKKQKPKQTKKTTTTTKKTVLIQNRIVSKIYCRVYLRSVSVSGCLFIVNADVEVLMCRKDEWNAFQPGWRASHKITDLLSKKLHSSLFLHQKFSILKGKIPGLSRMGCSSIFFYNIKDFLTWMKIS